MLVEKRGSEWKEAARHRGKAASNRHLGLSSVPRIYIIFLFASVIQQVTWKEMF